LRKLDRILANNQQEFAASHIEAAMTEESNSQHLALYDNLDDPSQRIAHPAIHN